jgi:hypothetical protein
MKLELYPVPLLKTDERTDTQTCPICGAKVERQRIGQKAGWSCTTGGYAHYFQTEYGYLKQWFTSGKGNLREPVIDAMNCVQTDYAA